MAPLLDDYTIRLRNLHKRYKLSQTVMGLFKALGEHRRGYDPDALGRLMRMSPGMRKACTDTISQLAKVMQNDQSHSTVAECTELIQNCTEMLALANEAASDNRLPLMKLPPEVRRRVYQQYFKVLPTTNRYGHDVYPNRIIIYKKTVSECHCLPIDSRKTASVVDLSLAFTSKVVKDEVLAAWFESQTFYFTCGCELKKHISNNASLRDNLRKLKVHWTGPQSAVGFKLLRQVSTLKQLVIVISKSTTNHLSDREEELQTYFTHKSGRLTDALGLDELLALRGLDYVEVQHISRSQANRRTAEESHNLEGLLKAKITV